MDLLARSLFRPSSILFELFESLKKNLLLEEFDPPLQETSEDDRDKCVVFLLVGLDDDNADDSGTWVERPAAAEARFWYSLGRGLVAAGFSWTCRPCKAESNASDKEKFIGVVSKYVDKIPLLRDALEDEEEDDEVEEEDDEEEEEEDDGVDEDNDGNWDEFIDEPNEATSRLKYCRVRGKTIRLLAADVSPPKTE